MTDFFSTFFLQFLGALENLGGAMDVIYIMMYAGQHGGFVETRLVNFPKFEEFLSHFLYGYILQRRKFLTKGL